MAGTDNSLAEEPACGGVRATARDARDRAEHSEETGGPAAKGDLLVLMKLWNGCIGCPTK